MKLASIATGLALVAVSTILVACSKTESKRFTEQSSGVVAFPDAGISIEVGDGWKRIDISAGPPVCPPTLVGEHGILRAMLFDANRSDVENAAASLKTAFEANPSAIKDSFRQEEFTTESGLHGLHLYYTSRDEKEGSTTEVRSHNYIIKNRGGRCVSVSHIAPTESDGAVVQQIVLKSLKSQ